MFKPFAKHDKDKDKGKDKGKGKLLRPKGKKRFFKKRPCKFCIEKSTSVDYLDYHKFSKFVTERGKIVPSRISGNCAKHQRMLARAIRKARVMALLPFVSE